MKVLCISKWAKAPSPAERDAILVGPENAIHVLSAPKQTKERDLESLKRSRSTDLRVELARILVAA